MMKAAVVVANEDVQYLEIEEPQVTEGTVKVKVAMSGICGSDVPRVLYNGVHFYPIVLGHEFSGEIVEVGEKVSNVKVGDRVAECRWCHVWPAVTASRVTMRFASITALSVQDETAATQIMLWCRNATS